jgi:uncharacterized protein YqhQ
MVKQIIRRLIHVLAKQYTSIGGQAVIEGVMMRSPNSFVVAVRTPTGKIRLRKDQWFGLSQRFDFLKKPFFRGILMLVETMANGIVSLNYSANIAMEEELKAKALKKGKTEEQFNQEQKKKEKVDWATFFTIVGSFLFGMGLFVFVPHTVTAWISQAFNLEWNLDGFMFHFVDGTIKACIFISYIYFIGFIPDIKRVFQYHGAEHKSISTFEAKQALTVENARKHTTLHPRCGTSFIFFLLFISIILFSGIFAVVPVGVGLPVILKHLVAILFKIALMLPVAGISYEIIKFAGKHAGNPMCRLLSTPGMMLQKLTTKEPDDEQLEVALASIKTVLFLEEKYQLNQAKQKVVELEEIDIEKLDDIEPTNKNLEDFLE